MDTSPSIPGFNTIRYIPNFVTPEEEEHLIRKIKETPHQKWKQLGGRRLQVWGGEILQNGALVKRPFPAFLIEYPDLISRLEATGIFASSPHGQPNHVILNEYLQGQGIMPHEDGPVYHPVVATISLASHTVFHYYQYANESSLRGTRPHPELPKNGRSIDNIPLVSLLLERRSLVVTTGEMYMSHLHGIEERADDKVLRGGLIGLSTGGEKEIANGDLLSDEDIIEVIRHGGTMKRCTRYSLTCRDVGHVAKLTM